MTPTVLNGKYLLKIYYITNIITIIIPQVNVVVYLCLALYKYITYLTFTPI